MFRYTLTQEVQIESDDGTFKTFRRTSLADNVKSLMENAEENLGKLQSACEREELK